MTQPEQKQNPVHRVDPDRQLTKKLLILGGKNINMSKIIGFFL